MSERDSLPRHSDRGRSDFEQRIRGEITSEEYVRRLEERVRENQRNGAPMRSAKDVAARFFPKSFRLCRHCNGTGVDRHGSR